jgi:hypothetical protein
MTTIEDLLYKDCVRGKKYMMGVSPWFYTGEPNPLFTLNLPNSKPRSATVE